MSRRQNVQETEILLFESMQEPFSRDTETHVLSQKRRICSVPPRQIEIRYKVNFLYRDFYWKPLVSLQSRKLRPFTTQTSQRVAMVFKHFKTAGPFIPLTRWVAARRKTLTSRARESQRFPDYCVHQRSEQNMHSSHCHTAAADATTSGFCEMSPIRRLHPSLISLTVGATAATLANSTGQVFEFSAAMTLNEYYADASTSHIFKGKRWLHSQLNCEADAAERLMSTPLSLCLKLDTFEQSIND